jgi:bacterioferritin-associated ferredoxin
MAGPRDFRTVRRTDERRRAGLIAVFVCLCTGTTSHVVSEVVANGAKTSKQIAEACGAGGDCGRCRRTLRAMIEAHYAGRAAEAVSL